MTPRSVAVQGFGFGALAIATMGLLGGAVAQPEIGLERFVDAAVEQRELDATDTVRDISATPEERTAMAQEVQRTIEVQPVISGIDVTDEPVRAISVAAESREIEVTDV